MLYPSHCNDGDDGAAWFDEFPKEADANLIIAAPDMYEAIKKAEALISVLMGFHGQGLEVVNWHKNGDLESLDNFFDSNMDDDELDTIRKALSIAEGRYK